MASVSFTIFAGSFPASRYSYALFNHRYSFGGIRRFTSSASFTACSTAFALSWLPFLASVSTISRSTSSPPTASMIRSLLAFCSSVNRCSCFVTTSTSSPCAAKYAAFTASLCASSSAICCGLFLDTSMSIVPVMTLPRANSPPAVWRLSCASVAFSALALSACTSYSTPGLVGVHASAPYTRFALSTMGSIVSLPNTSDTGPYFVCPSRAFTTAMDGDGIPPSCSASRRFCSVRLCTATSSFWPSTSTGALSAKRTVFCTAALFSLLSPASRAILVLAGKPGRSPPSSVLKTVSALSCFCFICPSLSSTSILPSDPHTSCT